MKRGLGQRVEVEGTIAEVSVQNVSSLFRGLTYPFSLHWSDSSISIPAFTRICSIFTQADGFAQNLPLSALLCRVPFPSGSGSHKVQPEMNSPKDGPSLAWGSEMGSSLGLCVPASPHEGNTQHSRPGGCFEKLFGVKKEKSIGPRRTHQERQELLFSAESTGQPFREGAEFMDVYSAQGAVWQGRYNCSAAVITAPGRENEVCACMYMST